MLSTDLLLLFSQNTLTEMLRTVISFHEHTDLSRDAKHDLVIISDDKDEGGDPNKEVMKKAVEDEDLDVLLRRVAAMEKLRSLLETNVVEALALEVSLMKTFGEIS